MRLTRNRKPILPLLVAGMLTWIIVCSAHATSVTEHQAKALFEQKRWPEAYVAYMSLFREFPDNTDIQLGLARSAVATGQHSRALIVYEQLVQRFPENPALWQELAQVYTALGNHESASAALNKPVKPGALIPLSTETQNLLKIQSRLSTGIVYDSNISLAPSDDRIPIGNTYLTLVGNSTDRESWGTFISAAIGLNRRIHASSPWWWIADFGAYQKWYFDEDTAMTWGRAATGFHYELNNLSWTMRLKGEQSLSDFEGLATVVGGEGNFGYRFLPNTYLLTRAEYGLRDYPDSPGHCDTYGWIGEYIRVLFSNNKHEILAGGRWISNSADNPKFSADGWETSGQIRFSLPFESDISFLTAFEKRSYDKPAFSNISYSREDEKIRLGVKLTHHLTNCFSTSLSFQHLENDSNTELYDYAQNIVSLGVTWEF